MLKKPSDFHSCLTDDCIDHIGHLIARVRSENLDSADERDSGWSIGCRAYQWICSEIVSESQEVPWLDVVDPTLRFIGKIGNVEFSFYKGMANKPKNNIVSRAQSYPELKQGALFSDISVPEKLAWAYAVETDLEGITTNIEFFGMTPAGDVVASRTVPLFSTYTKVVEINSTESLPADLPAAPVSLPRRRKEKVSGLDVSKE